MNKRIIALTTDPYDNIYGYALVFIKLFNFIQKNQKKIEIILISNNGVCSRIINNKNFKQIQIKKKQNLFLKNVFFLTFQFIKKTLIYENKNSIIITNGEIPELIAAYILKIKFKKVYCIIQDLRIRNDSFKFKMIHRTRLFLLRKIKNCIFTNKYTMNEADNSLNKFYIGNPVF